MGTALNRTTLALKLIYWQAKHKQAAAISSRLTAKVEKE